MTGPTMMMAPAVEPSSSFPRSQSSPDLLSLSSLENPSTSTTTTPIPQRENISDIQSLPNFDLPTFNVDFNLDTNLDTVVFQPDEQRAEIKAPQPPSIVETKEAPEEVSPFRHARKRTSSLIDTRGWLPGSKSTSDLHNLREEPPRPTTSAGDKKFGDGSIGNLKPIEKPLTKSESFVNFAKRSWRPSRSPSPMKSADTAKENDELSGRNRSESTTSMKLTKTRKRPGLTVDQVDKNKSSESLKSSTPKAFSRASSYFSKLKSKQAGLSKLNTNTDSDTSCASSATSLAPPASTTTEDPTPQSSAYDTTSATTVTDESSVEMPPQQRDVLWSSFKAIDEDFKGFLAKSTAQRMSQVQTQLLPFLRSTMNHESTKKLCAEDVDRRATILNKWWITILEMLDGQAPQPVPGVDRPVLFDVATLLMTRLEWRQATSYFLPLVDRSPAEKVRARSMTNSSNSSITSSQAAFLEESAEHSVRTMFVTNLVKQMGFVVDKLSLRHTPASLVNFAGKACAYAFFFAPGVADILIRLWGLSPELIRRVADDLGLPKKNIGESDDIAALFPPTIGVFAWTSPKGMWDSLKKVPRLPMLVSRIPWTGPWAARWKGRDTDVFFIFLKYFHILSEQFMPPGLPLLEKARSPGFALVQAQLLYVLDTTIHRQAPMDGGFNPAAMDGMPGADAAMALPLPLNNVMRGMSENRCIMLLKDYLSDDSLEIAGARHTFAETFATMMKAATRRVSMYNHPACFTLCDFLEEVLVLYSEFEDPDSSDSYLDWPFWFDVCQKIMGSFNTMSEIRMMALIYSIWDAISRDPVRKLAVCKDWLLTEETFNEFFNHWCPMVRAYYQRLLSWRMCRDSGTLDEVDGQIFVLVAERLQTTWSHYLHIKHAAESEGRMVPSTAPVNPAPGKRFMIIRQEINVPQPGLYMGSFDSFAKLPNSETSVLNGLPPDASRQDGKKRWSLLGKVLSLGGNTNAGWDDDFQTVRRETAESRASTSSRASNTNSYKHRVSEDDSLYSQPTYEEPKYVFKFVLAWQQQAGPLRERFLTRPRLPGPAESRISGPLKVNGITRKFSGSPQQGLIDNAKNASLLDSAVEKSGPPRLELTLSGSSDDSDKSLGIKGSPSLAPSPVLSPSPALSQPPSQSQSPSPSPSPSPQPNTSSYTDTPVHPVKPTGLYVKNSVYAGRALAEWAQVVFECNNFIERRRDEGMGNLGDVEIPVLGVEGFRKVGG
ncbi:hypothetical protein FPSE_05624 [Fusarium pseudograminearum CS3096]|uniref:Uncharacterized protein n=1 Tax=Fusarium pseudograminearum (strain CS3096) TaxID=1028729 RepID=K3W0I0_FUSPC|nr:hypothetical protein FPSE_05624 [Fusarium pseudograminearum CS3096]EKJ74185.1 hypothetical protein FPSE_05624 [Fusarium pseudograminearum CS3096]